MTNKSLSLYEVAEAYQSLSALLEDGQQEELQVYLDGIEMQMKDKVSQVIRFSKNLELTADAVNTEIDRLKELKKSYEAHSLSLKNYISYSMQKHDIDNINTDIAKLFFRKSTTVEIDEEAKLPQEYLVEKTTYAPDKKAIKEALLKGEIIDGARIANHNNLQIK